MKEAVIKIITMILCDGERIKRALVIILSIIVGLLGLIIAPVIMILSIENMELPVVDLQFNEETFLSELPTDTQNDINKFQTDCRTIAEFMYTNNLNEEIIKAQLIYVSFADSGKISDLSEFAWLFTEKDNEVLVSILNEKYGIEMDHDDFMRTYTLIMNQTINAYMFTDSTTKNASDLAAWARNAYMSGWAFKENTFGEQDSELRYRCTDNVGLIMGYLRYDPTGKVFISDTIDMLYTEQGSIDIMPDVEGITVYDGVDFGIYTGSGEVIFSSAMGGCVQRSAIADGSWASWCTVEGIEYPQEVQDRIDELNEPTTETTTEGE